MATTTTTTPSHLTSSFPQNYSFNPPRIIPISLRQHPFHQSSATRCQFATLRARSPKITCKATEVSVSEQSPTSGGENWVPVVPLAALPKGERRVIIQDEETILLLWYKDDVFAIENRSPAEGAYSEGLLNAKLTQDGCIVCPTTDSTFDLRNGAIKDWYPKNPVLRALTPPLRTLYVYPIKTDEENIYINMKGGLKTDASAEIVFSGKAQPGLTASDVNVDAGENGSRRESRRFRLFWQE